MCKESDHKAIEELLEGKIDVEEYVNRLDSRGASVSASSIIVREVKEITNAVIGVLNRDIFKKSHEDDQNDKNNFSQDG
jgi:hypothetical protein